MLTSQVAALRPYWLHACSCTDKEDCHWGRRVSFLLWTWGNAAPLEATRIKRRGTENTKHLNQGKDRLVYWVRAWAFGCCVVPETFQFTLGSNWNKLKPSLKDFFSVSTNVKIIYTQAYKIIAVTGYRKVLRIATHVENNIVWIQFEDAGHCVWKVTFRRDPDGLLWFEVLCDVNFSILVNSGGIVDTQIIC